MTEYQNWDQKSEAKAVDILLENGGTLVSPTKVGYIIMASDFKGLERKFEVKKRKKNKPGVVLCSSLEQLSLISEMNEEIEKFYKSHWDRDILIGCILPWSEKGKKFIPKDGARTLMMDTRDTSCFVIKFGRPSENIAKILWDRHKKLVFASSANPSGIGNKGQVNNIGQNIAEGVDFIIEADDYVRSIQPRESEDTRYEQGVMVSMVDGNGKLVPKQKSRRNISPAPRLIRKGLDNDLVMSILSQCFESWDYRQGDYY